MDKYITYTSYLYFSVRMSYAVAVFLAFLVLVIILIVAYYLGYLTVPFTKGMVATVDKTPIKLPSATPTATIPSTPYSGNPTVVVTPTPVTGGPGPVPGGSTVRRPSMNDFVGCYADCTNGRDLNTRYTGGTTTPAPNGAGDQYTLEQCYEAAKAAGSDYYGLQFWEGTGDSPTTMGECWYTVGKTGYGSMGTKDNCRTGTNGYTIGGNCSNAVYKV